MCERTIVCFWTGTYARWRSEGVMMCKAHGRDKLHVELICQVSHPSGSKTTEPARKLAYSMQEQSWIYLYVYLLCACCYVCRVAAGSARVIVFLCAKQRTGAFLRPCPKGNLFVGCFGQRPNKPPAYKNQIIFPCCIAGIF